MLTYPLRANGAPHTDANGNSSLDQSNLSPDQGAAIAEPRASRTIGRRENGGAGDADAMDMEWLHSGIDGLTLIEAMRQRHLRSPAMVLSALAALAASDLICDDHPTKSTAIVELVAQIKALLRRLDEEPNTILRVGPVELDLLERAAKSGERRIELRPRQFRLLEYMMRRKDQLVTRAMLFKDVWNYKFVPQSNLVDVHMGALRRKLQVLAERPMIYSIRGKGFVLRDSA